MTTKFVLTLYVAGHTRRSEIAIANIKEICEQDLGGKYELHVVDIMREPTIAETKKILATPTLVKELPPPLRRVIGDLSDRDRVLMGLDISADYNEKDDEE